MKTELTEDRQWFVYVLKCPTTGDVRYVGWTVDMKRRLRDHMKSCIREKTHKGHWLKLLKSKGLNPICEVIDSGYGNSYAAAEKAWITHYKSIGASLTNATDGGDGTPGRTHSAETRAKMRGRKNSPESIERMRQAARKRKPRSPETIEKIRQSSLGRKNSPETIERISQSQKGHKVSDEAREKLRQAALGRKRSPESIEKGRQWALGRKWEPDRKQNPKSIEAFQKAALAVAIPVRRVEDGMVFESISSAARHMNRKPCTIAAAIKSGGKSAGYHWERLDKDD